MVSTIRWLSSGIIRKKRPSLLITFCWISLLIAKENRNSKSIDLVKIHLKLIILLKRCDLADLFLRKRSNTNWSLFCWHLWPFWLSRTRAEGERVHIQSYALLSVELRCYFAIAKWRQSFHRIGYKGHDLFLVIPIHFYRFDYADTRNKS